MPAGPDGSRPKPLLSVLIATYNRAGYLTKAVASVLNQSYSNFTLKIVDDASTDDTPEVIRSIDDPRLVSYRQPSNRGWLGNCNSALEGIGTKYVLMLGDDDIMMPGGLERAIAVLEAHPNVGMVHTSLNVIDSEGRQQRADTNWTANLSADTLETGPAFIRTSMLHGCRVCASTVMMRTSALPEVPFLPADGPAADVGLWLRIALDWDVYFLATPSVNYRVHAGSDSANWSIPASAVYVESVKLILKIREMKLRFLDDSHGRLPDERSLRRTANLVAIRNMVMRCLGPQMILWIREQRSRLARRHAHSVPGP
jgi:hypothetical protein